MDQAEQPKKLYSYLMMAGHVCCDMNQGTLPALLPFLVLTYGFDYTAAAGLMFALNSLSSLVQPLIGMLSDRKPMPWLLGLGLLMSGLGIAAAGFFKSYWAIFTVVLLAGFGVALFHPEGARIANYAAGEKKGRGMGVFSAGGNLGFVLGPIVATFVVTLWGLKGISVLLLPTLPLAAILFALRKRFVQLAPATQRSPQEKMAASEEKDDWRAFSILCIPIFMRSIVKNGLRTFIPLYWVGVLLQTQQQGSLIVTLMAIGSTLAAFTGGPLGDRFGFRRVIRLSTAAVLPLMLLLLLTDNIALATGLILPLMLTLFLAHSPSVVLGQKYLPNRLGLASGVTLGLAVSRGGIFSPLLGMVGDHYGLTTTLYVVAGVALLGFLSTLPLKEPAADKTKVLT